MSNENKTDNDLHFPALDAGKPTEDWERFDRDLMSYLGGKADKSGSSPADHLHDVDMAPQLLDLTQRGEVGRLGVRDGSRIGVKPVLDLLHVSV